MEGNYHLELAIRNNLSGTFHYELTVDRGVVRSGNSPFSVNIIDQVVLHIKTSDPIIRRYLNAKSEKHSLSLLYKPTQHSTPSNSALDL